MKRWLVVATLCLFVPSFAQDITNTATVNFVDAGAQSQSLDSNTVSTTVIPNPTPAEIYFMGYAPPVGSESLRAEGTLYWDGSSFQAAPAPTTPGGGPIDTLNPIPLNLTSTLRTNEPLFVKLEDINRNADPLQREYVTVQISATTGDVERLQLLESEVNSGVFVGVVNTDRAPPLIVAVTQFNGILSVAPGVVISVEYEDDNFPSDTAEIAMLVDPYGVVFNSTTGALVDGVLVTLVNAADDSDAIVLDDNGDLTSNKVVTGCQVVGPTCPEVMPSGSYRFPQIPAGDYKIILSQLPANSAWPTSIAPGSLALLTNPNTNLPFALPVGYEGSSFTVSSGDTPLNIDLPIDIAGTTEILLSKSVSRNEASHGDFLRYELLFRNLVNMQADDVVLTDILPYGFRFKSGSLRIDGVKSNDPTISSDGRTLSISLGDVPMSGDRRVSYVTEVGAGARIGPATNYATATRSNGSASNQAEVTVTVRDAFFASHAVLMGRVLEVSSCDVDLTDEKAVKGVAKIRVLMENGTYVATDEEGRFHFEKVTPGTHVVQVDPNSLAKNLELVACDKNTRFAGRANSQFVDVKGGALWTTNFFVKQREVPKGMLKVELDGEIGPVSEESVTEAIYTLKLKALDKLSVITVAIKLPRDFSYLPLSGKWMDKEFDGTMVGDKLVFKVPALEKDQEGVLSFRTIPIGDISLVPDVCLPEAYEAQADLIFRVRDLEGAATLKTHTPTCAKAEVKVEEGQIIDVAQKVKEEVVLDDIRASGGGRDWIKGEIPGVAILFPEENYNPRAPSTRLVVKHGKDHILEPRLNGELVSNVHFDGMHANANKSINATEWKGVPLREGDNFIEIAVRGPAGDLVQILKRTIHYSNEPDRVIFIPEKSRLIANGIDKPRIAVRVVNKEAKPVRKGVKGSFTVNDPYVPAQFEDFAKRRQLSALDRFEPEYTVDTDDGISYVELAPTNESGEVKMKFLFEDNRSIEINVWLEPAVQDWVVVGFVEGTAGYETLKGNMTEVDGAEKNKELHVDDQVKLYAKGRVSGEWIATVAYDSEKQKAAKENNFKSIIDPNEFYTLYGDNTTQRNDAPSSDKLYLKLEKSRFYALFGDYDAGLNETELARYNRSFTGVKSEYSGKFLGFKIFGAQQDGYYYKDEMQAQSIAMNYRLSRGAILVNSEKIRLIVRNRFRSDLIVSEEVLSRHIDYTIDYRAGTINFKRTVETHDGELNPRFIVAEYETLGAATKDYTYGGRGEVKVLEDKVKVGFTHIEEDAGLTSSNLQGVDARVKLAEQTELKLEAAESRGDPNGVDIEGDAYRAEVDHRSQRVDANAYLKETSRDFGIGQQAASENGSFKTGAKTSLHLNKNFDFNSSYDHQRQIASGNTQDIAASDLKFKHQSGSLSVGAKKIDEDRGTEEIESTQATANVTQRFFNSKLDLQATAEQNLGDQQSVDYPNRYVLQAGFKLTDKIRLIAAQEYTDGNLYDSSTTRVGFESTPWKGARLGSTLNQSVSEYGPRTYSTMGLAQSLPLGKNWTFDGAVDATTTLKERGPAVPINASQPLTSGGFLGNGAFTEDYVATTGGVTYRAEPWTWNFRIENRMGEVEDRIGAATHLIRELSKGIVLGTTHQYFRSDFVGGANGQLFQGDLSLAYRPSDSRWTLLDRVKYRYEMVDNAQSLPIFGQTTLKGVDDAISSAIVNNLNINRLSKTRKNQFSVYYGTKVVWDIYDGDRYQSYIDLYGLEIRQDITEKWDIGFQGSLLNSWSTDTMKYSYGPSVGWTPVTNSWLSVGYNFRGFYDRDFDAARYTGQGIYLKMRLKFDEKTLGLKKDSKGEAK